MFIFISEVFCHRKEIIIMKPENLWNFIKKKRIDGFFISNLKNIRYLTGFTGSSGFLLIIKNRGLLFTDFRYKEQAGYEVRDWEVVIEKSRRTSSLKKTIKRLGIKKLGFENTISYSLFEIIRKNVTEAIPLRNLIENLRKYKNAEEITNISKAIKIAEDAFLKTKPFLKIGIKEKEFANRLEYEIKNFGCRNLPFDIIVASGKNSSMPHARPTEKLIAKGDFVIIDWGAESNGYYSDITRTFLINGQVNSKKIEIYNIVNAARHVAIMSGKEGVKAKEIDSAARNYIKTKGYGEFFGHSTGHGVGLDVHEAPSISQSSNEKILESMIFTIEPGIYLNEIGGVRIEDMVTIQNKKPVVLTSLPRDMEIIS